VKAGSGKAVHFLWASMKLNLRLNLETVHSETKERLYEVCVVRPGVRHFLSCCVTRFILSSAERFPRLLLGIKAAGG
jgi:hypothetical protein